MKANCILIASAAIALAVSCTVELGQNVIAPERTTQELTITATAEASVTTRTELSQTDGAVLWTPGDAISLFYGSGTDGGSCFTSTATEKTAVTNFTGTIGVITGGAEISAEDTYFWGLYPYSPTVSCDGSSVTMSLSATQTAMAGSFAPGTSPSLGRSQGLSLGFYNICGGVKFTVTHEGIKKVTLRSNGGEQIAGTAKVIFDDSGLPKVQEILSGTDEITLEAPEGQYFEVGQYYYIMMFPTKFNSGFTLTLETFTESATVEKNSVINITRSYFGRMLNVDGSATYAQKIGNIPIPDANFKAYMVEQVDTDNDGEISYEEALLITRINVNTDNIASVRGIEYCLNLQDLHCSGSVHYDNTLGRVVGDGMLTSLDVSNNTALTRLYFSFNQLSCLDVSNNTALTELYCSYNQLSYLDVSNNTALTRLECNSNDLTSLDVSNNTALTALYVSNNTALTRLFCFNNKLTILNVSNDTALTQLYCYNNQLTSLDVSSNTALEYLDCSPMNNSFGHNLLRFLYIASGQNIPNVTENRNNDNIPSETEIVPPGLSLNKTSLSLPEGLSETLQAFINPGGVPAGDVVWSSTDETVATVDGTGTVTALKEGATTITAIKDDYVATCDVTVTVVSGGGSEGSSIVTL